MWFEERSWSNLKMSELIEEWRDLWSFKVDFIVASLSYVFATTNLLNLPKMILENGGLAFVSAYGASLLAVVLPTIILELAIGQLTGRAPVLAFYNLVPLFKGIGVAQILYSLMVLACMTRFVGWLCLFLFHLFWTVWADRPGLPWLNCKNFPELVAFPCREAGSLANFTANTHTKLNAIHDESSLMQFINSLERPSSSIVDFGDFQHYLLSAQGAVWIGVFLAICFGVRWLGKVIPFTFMASFSLLLALLIRACTMDGLWQMLEGVWTATDWDRMMDYHMWKLAAEQAILASGIGYGAFITIGSYNKRSNNLVGDTILIVLGHALLTTMQVVMVFGLVGYVAVKTGLQPLELLDQGETQLWHLLAYLSYVPNIKLWSGMLLAMCILVLGNVFFLLSLSVLATLEDAFGEKASRCFPRFLLAFLTVAFGYGLSIYFTTQAGRHAYELATGFLKYITLWAILAAELFVTAWFYCAHRLGKDLHSMLRAACCWCLGHFILLFTYLLPIVPIAIGVLNALDYDFSSYSPAVRSWEWSEYVGAGLALLPLTPIPYYVYVACCCACCCRASGGETRCQRAKDTIKTRLGRDSEKGACHPGAGAAPRYTSSAPGYLLLPQAPLAEPETFEQR